MKRFELGMAIKEGNTYVVTAVTEKMVTFKEIQHYGRINERVVSERKCKIHNWKNGQAAVFGKEKTLEAI